MVGDRIKKLRNDLGFTQSDLADKVGLTYIQIGRYEKGKSNPSADVLQKIAHILNTSTDFLMNGKNEHTDAQLKDKQLMQQFKEVEKLKPEDKNLVMTFIDAFITKKKIQQLAS